MEKEANFIELGKGLLIVFSYFIIGNLLSDFFSNLIKNGTIPDTTLNRALLNFSIYLILAIFYAILYRKTLINDFKTFKKNPSKNMTTGINYWLRGLFIMILSNIIIVYVFKLGNSANEQTNIELIKKYMAIQVPLTVFLTPFIEEIVFRGSFYKFSDNKHIFALTTGLFFGFVHIISSLDNPLGFLYLVPYSSMGIAFGYLYKKTDSIYTSMFMHMIHNAVTISFIILAIKMGIY